MMDSNFVILECDNQACHFRFSARKSEPQIRWCPKCHGSSSIKENFVENPLKEVINKNSLRIDVLLDNIRSAYNVGSILRTSDGLNIHHLYLCGITPTPENPKVGKTGLGAELSTPWTYSPNSVDLIKSLDSSELKIIGLERTNNSIPLDQVSNLEHDHVLLIIGNELAGIDPFLRRECHQLIHIPMFGHKKSFNVTIAFGIAVYHLQLISKN